MKKSPHPYSAHPTLGIFILSMLVSLGVVAMGRGNLAADVAQQSSAEDIWQVREQRVEGLREMWLKGHSSVEDAFHEEEALREERILQRQECRERLRKANRDQQFSAVLECMANEWTALLRALQKRGQRVDALAGPTEATRREAGERIAAAIDALDTVVTALRTGVYETQDLLIETRENLREKYLRPVWDIELKLYAETMLAWTDHLLLRIRALQESSASEKMDDSALREAEYCYIDAETKLLQASILEDLSAMKEILSQVQSTLKFCDDALERAHVETSPSSSSAS